MVGGLVRAYVNRHTSQELAQERGVLLASGLVGGDACIGIAIAFLTLAKVVPAEAAAKLPDWVSFAAYLLLALGLAFYAMKKRRANEPG